MTVKKNYVDKQELYDELCDWHERKLKAAAEGKRPPPLPDSIGRVIITIADRMASRPNFRNYTYIEEMRGDAIVNAVKAANSFDPNRVSQKTGEKNPFGFLSLVIWRAFLTRIKSEKKEQEGKMKQMVDPTNEFYTRGEDNMELDTSGVGNFLFENR